MNRINEFKVIGRELASRVKAAIPMEVKARLGGGNGLRPTDAGVWDLEFGRGQWNFMGDLAEVPRYAVIAGYVATCRSRQSVLDVGCGPGLLQPWLERAGYDAYLGIDLSSVAIESAQIRANATTGFQPADAESFLPTRSFDIIIFNEMLYYMRDPVAVLRHYGRYLTPEGSFVISLWHCRESWRVWKACDPILTVVDRTRVDNGVSSWNIRLCRLLRT